MEYTPDTKELILLNFKEVDEGKIDSAHIEGTNVAIVNLDHYYTLFSAYGRKDQKKD